MSRTMAVVCRTVLSCIVCHNGNTPLQGTTGFKAIGRASRKNMLNLYFSFSHASLPKSMETSMAFLCYFSFSL